MKRSQCLSALRHHLQVWQDSYYSISKISATAKISPQNQLLPLHYTCGRLWHILLLICHFI